MTSVGYATMDVIPSMRGLQGHLDRQAGPVLRSYGTKAGQQMGAAAMPAFASGFKRDVNGRLRDSRGKFVQEYGKAGEDAGRRAGRGLSMGMGGALKGFAGISAAIGIAGFVKDSVQLEASFSKTMSVIQATTSASGREMSQLRDLAKQMGADTVFSANEVSASMLELARGGLTAADIQAGALKGTLTLAAAGELEMGEAANTAVKAMGQFNLRGRDMDAIAAALAGSANASSASVRDMGIALSQSGLAANSVGFSVQETTGILAAFSNAGLEGSDAGTSLKTMLDRLQPSTTAAKAALNGLGIVTEDGRNKFLKANGEYKSAAQIAELLHKGTEDLTASERKRLITMAFGSDAQRAATILSKEGAAGIREMVKATSDQDAAQRMANANMEGTAGSLERLGGAWETLKLQVGEGLAPLIQGGAEGLADVMGLLSGERLSGGGQFLQETMSGLSHYREEVEEIFGGISRGWDNISNSLGKVSGKHGGMFSTITRNAADFSHAMMDVAGPAVSWLAETGLTNLGSALELLGDGIKAGGNGFFTFSDVALNVMGAVVETVSDGAANIIGGFLQIAEAGAFLKVPGMEGVAGSLRGLQTEVEGYGDGFKATSEGIRADLADQRYLFNLTGAEAETLGNRILALPDEVNTYVSAPGMADSANELVALQEKFRLTPEELVTVVEMKKTSLAMGDIAKLNKLYGLSPEEITTLVRLNGTVNSRGEIAQLHRAYKLTPNQVLTILRASGGKLTTAEVMNLNAVYGLTPKRLVTLLQQTGKDLTVSQVNDLVDKYGLAEKTRTALLRAFDHASGPARAAKRAAEEFERTYTATMITRRLTIFETQRGKIASTGGHEAPKTQQANGGILTYGRRAFADGGFGIDGRYYPRESQIVKGGADILWAEQATRREAYISDKPSMRDRNVRILDTTAGWFGYDLVKAYADGGTAGPERGRGDGRDRRDGGRGRRHEERERDNNRQAREHNKHLRTQIGHLKKMVDATRELDRTIAENFLTDPFENNATLQGVMDSLRADLGATREFRSAARGAKRLGLSGPAFRSLLASGNTDVLEDLDTRAEIRQYEQLWATRARITRDLSFGSTTSGRYEDKTLDQLNGTLRRLERRLKELEKVGDRVEKGAHRGTKEGQNRKRRRRRDASQRVRRPA